MPHHPTPLKFLMPGWFAIVMGLSGLALAWHRAAAIMGETASAAALGVGVLAAAVALALAVASLVRWRRYPEAVAKDLRHPVRHAFIAAMRISLILLATVLVALVGPVLPARLLWMAGALWQFVVTLWVLRRWLAPAKADGLNWPMVTPALFIPVVGNVLVPLAGVPLGLVEWSAAQFGLGLLFWPVLLVLLVVRMAVQGLWPERLLPTTFIFVAPPAVIGLAVLQLGAPALMGWMAWGMALFLVLWAGSLVRRILAHPFAIPFWGMSFPLAAFSALTLRPAARGPAWFQSVAVMLLALTSLVIAGLLLATFRGLRNGSLLEPEPVAPIVVAA